MNSLQCVSEGIANNLPSPLEDVRPLSNALEWGIYFTT